MQNIVPPLAPMLLVWSPGFSIGLQIVAKAFKELVKEVFTNLMFPGPPPPRQESNFHFEPQESQQLEEKKNRSKQLQQDEQNEKINNDESIIKNISERKEEIAENAGNDGSKIITDTKIIPCSQIQPLIPQDVLQDVPQDVQQSALQDVLQDALQDAKHDAQQNELECSTDVVEYEWQII